MLKKEVSKKLTNVAYKKHLKQIRICGNEPTISRGHLIKVLDLLDGKYLFILETNGVLIGADEEYAKDLSKYKNLYVRVSLKGTCEEEFSKLTGALPEGFRLQLKALENLLRYKVNVHPACMISFSPQGNREALKNRLKTIHSNFAEFEVEELILYPHVEERLKRLNIPYFTSYRPDRIPKEQI